MAYSNLRKGRVSLPGHAYLVTTVTAERAPHFFDLYVARIVILEMRSLEAQGLVTSLAFVLMPDHLHWLLQLQPQADLSNIMRCLKARSAHKINDRLGRIGPVWQPTFHDRGLRANESIRETARYLAANPLRAGLVTQLSDYPHWDAGWL